MRWISPVLLFLSIGTVSLGSAEPELTTTGKPVLLPDLVIDTTSFGPAFCLNIDVRNIGSGSKPSGSAVTYQLDAMYHNPERSRTVTGTLTDLTPIEIPSNSDRATAICDVSGDAINAYRMGLIRLTLNPTAGLPEVSTANNRAISPHPTGSERISRLPADRWLWAARVPTIRSLLMYVSKISAISDRKPCRGSWFELSRVVPALAPLRPTRFTI